MSTIDSKVRASDSDRERAVAELRRHAGEGRLDLAELEERVAAALRARTTGELAGLLEDLPSARSRARPRLGPELRTFVAVQALLVGIWALTGMGYFWPIWPMLGWGIPLLACSGSRRSGSARSATSSGRAGHCGHGSGRAPARV